MVFADRLRERRKELGKTVSQCAAFLHKTQPAWTLYETGKRLPKLDELLEICRLLDTTPNDLLGVSSSSVDERERVGAGEGEGQRKFSSDKKDGFQCQFSTYFFGQKPIGKYDATAWP